MWYVIAVVGGILIGLIGLWLSIVLRSRTWP